MERLTTKLQTALIKGCDCQEEPNCYENFSCDEIDIAIEKLRDYENTGLTPGQIYEMDKLYREKCEEVAALKKMKEGAVWQE